MAGGPEQIFLFVQCELPWALGPPDGRYLLRSTLTGKPERVVILGTLDARRGAHRSGRLARARARRRPAPAQPEPEPVATTRATIVDAVPVAAERQARAWLDELDPEREIPLAFAALNRLLHARRIATADPYLREASPEQALTIRAGWGGGERVAEGEWAHAVELPWGGGRSRGSAGRGSRRPPRGRAAALRPDERLARLLALREQPLVCEELVLRARLDLDQSRLAHAAIELDRALVAALGELAAEQRADLPRRVSELRDLREGVSLSARAALGLDDRAKGEGAGGLAASSAGAGAGAGATATADGRRGGTVREQPDTLDEDAIRHALERLEAALRARSAAGYDDART